MIEQLRALPAQEHLARQEVIREAIEWIPTQFMHGAAIKNVGAECGSFVLRVYNKFGFAPGYTMPMHKIQWHLHKDSPSFDPTMYTRELERFSKEVDGPPLPADVALFWWGHAYSHSAIVIEWPTRLIHCFERGGVQFVDASRDPFCKRFMYSHPVRFFSPWRPE